MNIPYNLFLLVQQAFVFLEMPSGCFWTNLATKYAFSIQRKGRLEITEKQLTHG